MAIKGHETAETRATPWTIRLKYSDDETASCGGDTPGAVRRLSFIARCYSFEFRSILMELGFGGMNACPENSGKKIYLFRDYVWNVLYQVVRSKEEMRATTWSGIATGKTPR